MARSTPNPIELDEETAKKYEKICKERLELEEYSHSMIWKTMEFFAALIPGLITVGLGLVSSNLHAFLTVMMLVILLTFLGHYILIQESRYFHEYRHGRVGIQRKLGYHELDIVKDFPDFQDWQRDREKYVNKYVKREKGVRYAFRITFFLQAFVSLVLGWAVFLLNFFGTLGPWSLEELGKALFQERSVGYIVALVFIIALTVVVILRYWWEIKTLSRHVKKRLAKLGR